MASIKFRTLFDSLRAITGNDDLDLGAEVLPDARLIVLLKTAVMTLPTYSSEFPTLSYRDPGDAAWEFFQSIDDLLPVSDPVVQAVMHVAAHKYYTGIGNREGVEQSLAFVLKSSENFAGQAVATFTT